MKNICCWLLASLTVFASPISAQENQEPSSGRTIVTAPPATSESTSVGSVATPVQQAVLMQPTTENILRAGTPIALRMREQLTTKGKDLRVGYRFQMEVAEPVMVNGVTVIPAGSPATGEVTDVRNKGMWGKSGKINARPLFVRANGRQIRLAGQMDDKGVTGTAGVVGSVALVPLAGFFMTGTSAQIPIGAPFSAFIDEDIHFAVASSQPVPMTVPAN